MSCSTSSVTVSDSRSNPDLLLACLPVSLACISLPRLMIVYKRLHQWSAPQMHVGIDSCVLLTLLIQFTVMSDRPGQTTAVQPHLTSGSASMTSMWSPGILASWTQTALGANTLSVPSTSQAPSRWTLLSKIYTQLVTALCGLVWAEPIPSILPAASPAWCDIDLAKSVHRHCSCFRAEKSALKMPYQCWDVHQCSRCVLCAGV